MKRKKCSRWVDRLYYYLSWTVSILLLFTIGHYLHNFHEASKPVIEYMEPAGEWIIQDSEITNTFTFRRVRNCISIDGATVGYLVKKDNHISNDVLIWQAGLNQMGWDSPLIQEGDVKAVGVVFQHECKGDIKTTSFRWSVEK